MLRERITYLARRREFKRALGRLMDGTAGPNDFETFFTQFLKDCNVTRPVLASEHDKIIWNESKRHLAMSYLQILKEDDPQSLIDKLEAQQRNHEQHIPEEKYEL